MKKIVGLFLVVMFALTSCSKTSTIGNGKVDPVEAATINLAVITALQVCPEASLPAYDVATAILSLMSSDTKEIVSLSVLDKALKKETDKLKLDPVTTQAFNNLVLLVKADIEARTNIEGMTESEKLIVVVDVVKIVQQTASLKLKYLQNK